MSSLLEGVRVIENASVITGPLTGMLLADLGADVVKVENPAGGDQFRKWDGSETAVNLVFANYNRGKRSITIDLRSKSGVEIYKTLARRADVVIENFRPGFVDRLGIGYESLAKVNPGLVYCEITGLGATGPYRDRPTFDAVAQALSGLWSTFIDLDRPEAIGPPMADQLTGIYGACAVLSALVARSRTGEGTKVSVNMLSSAMAFVGPSFSAHLQSEQTGSFRVPKKTDRAHGSQSYAFLDSDGKPFAIHLSTPEKFWESLCATIGRPEMATDERFDSKAKRVQNYDDIHDALAPIFKEKDRDAWLELLIAAQVPCAPIYTPGEALDDPQVRQLGMLWQDPTNGYSLIRSPIEYDGQFAAARRGTPLIGEQTDELLGELGYSEAEIARFHETGSV